MDQTSTTVVPLPKAPSKKKRRAKRRASRASKPTVAEHDTQVGISARQCAAACSPQCCVISLKPYCAHPAMCGLSPQDSVDPAAVKRLEAAKKRIAHQAVERKRA